MYDCNLVIDPETVGDSCGVVQMAQPLPVGTSLLFVRGHDSLSLTITRYEGIMVRDPASGSWSLGEVSVVTKIAEGETSESAERFFNL